ncbi:hypothetical protein ACI2KR_08610 [Pseudomonas luteola]
MDDSLLAFIGSPPASLWECRRKHFELEHLKIYVRAEFLFIEETLSPVFTLSTAELLDLSNKGKGHFKHFAIWLEDAVRDAGYPWIKAESVLDIDHVKALQKYGYKVVSSTSPIPDLIKPL